MIPLPIMTSQQQFAALNEAPFLCCNYRIGLSVIYGLMAVALLPFMIRQNLILWSAYQWSTWNWVLWELLKLAAQFLVLWVFLGAFIRMAFNKPKTGHLGQTLRGMAWLGLMFFVLLGVACAITLYQCYASGMGFSFFGISGSGDIIGSVVMGAAVVLCVLSGCCALASYRAIKLLTPVSVVSQQHEMP